MSINTDYKLSDRPVLFGGLTIEQINTARPTGAAPAPIPEMVAFFDAVEQVQRAFDDARIADNNVKGARTAKATNPTLDITREETAVGDTMRALNTAIGAAETASVAAKAANPSFFPAPKSPAPKAPGQTCSCCAWLHLDSLSGFMQKHTTALYWVNTALKVTLLVAALALGVSALVHFAPMLPTALAPLTSYAKALFAMTHLTPRCVAIGSTATLALAFYARWTLNPLTTK